MWKKKCEFVWLSYTEVIILVYSLTPNLQGMVQTFNLQTVKYDRTTGALLVYYLDQHGRTYLIDSNERELPAPFYTMSPAAIIAWANRPGIAERVLFLSPESWYNEAY